MPTSRPRRVKPNQLTIFTDASVTSRRAGGGYIAFYNYDVYYGTVPLEGFFGRNTKQAEHHAMQEALTRVLSYCPDASSVSVYTDCLDIARAYCNGTVEHAPSLALGPNLHAIAGRKQVNVRWIKGHRVHDSIAAKANHAADILANMARNGARYNRMLNWHTSRLDTISHILKDLKRNPKDRNRIIDRFQAAQLLNIPRGTIGKLIEAGYLKFCNRTGGIDRQSLQTIHASIETLRARNNTTETEVERAPEMAL